MSSGKANSELFDRSRPIYGRNFALAKGFQPEACWQILKTEDRTAAIGDQASIQWALMKKLGDVLTYEEETGLAFHGRSYGLCVSTPLDDPLSDSLRAAAVECVEACPTGALAWKSD